MKKMPAPSPYTYAENPRSRCIWAAANPTFTRSMKAAKYSSPRKVTRRVRTLRGALIAGTSSRNGLPAGPRDGVNSPGNIRLARRRERVYEDGVVLQHRSLKSCDLPLIVAAPHHDGFAIVRLGLEAADFGCHHRAAL